MSKERLLRDTTHNNDNPAVAGKYKGKWSKLIGNGNANKSKETSVVQWSESREFENVIPGLGLLLPKIFH